VIPANRAPIGQPATLYLWVYLSSVVGAAVFFDRPGVAVVGGVAMGLVALPYAWRLWLDRV
jgi:putative membrane protein